MASTYTPIATTTLSGATANYTFSSIPATYTDLILVANFIGASTAGNSLVFRVGNGSVDTGSNYSTTFLEGNGSSASSSRVSNGTFAYAIGSGSSTSTSIPQTNIIQFMNYANTSTYKTFINRGGSPDAILAANVNLWRSTVAINTIQIYIASENFNTGSTFTLYGIASA